jgi:hypothetical protein
MAAHRAKKRLKEEEMSDEALSFQLIQPYFTKLQSKMPGTLAYMIRDVDKRLLRTFVMLKPMVTAFRSCLPVLSLDACHLTSRFKGVLMSATMVDGERQTQLLAWGTAPIENFEHWNWFANLLRQGLAIDYTEQKREEQKGDGGEEQEGEQEGERGEGQKGEGDGDGEEEGDDPPPPPPPPPISRTLAIFTDREKGLALAIRNHFPDCSHFYCVFHIKKNIHAKFGLKGPLNNMLWAAANAPLVAEFRYWMKRIEAEDSRVHRYLEKIHPAQWATICMQVSAIGSCMC